MKGKMKVHAKGRALMGEGGQKKDVNKVNMGDVLSIKETYMNIEF
jgi:hypothetical protein